MCYAQQAPRVTSSFFSSLAQIHSYKMHEHAKIIRDPCLENGLPKSYPLLLFQTQHCGGKNPLDVLPHTVGPCAVQKSKSKPEYQNL